MLILETGHDSQPAPPGAGVSYVRFLENSRKLYLSDLETTFTISDRQKHGNNWKLGNSVVKVIFFTMLHSKQTFIANICENTSLRRLAGISVLYCWQQQQKQRNASVLFFFKVKIISKKVQ